MQDPCTVTIPCRFSYLNCFEPRAVKIGEPERYSVSAIIPKTDVATIQVIQAAITAAAQIGVEKKFGGKMPGALKLPLRDGSEKIGSEDEEVYKDCVFFSAHSNTRPGIVNANRQPIINQDDISSGDYGYVNVTFYAFNSNGAKGIATAFNHIMKTKDGEKLAGRISVENAFANIPMPQGQMPQMPQGQMPQMSQGQMPQMPQGQMPQGQMPQGQMPQGQMPQGQMPQIPGLNSLL